MYCNQPTTNYPLSFNCTIHALLLLYIVWFHVDDLSSAHVYLRMKPGITLDDITDDLLLDCASLVKANSIQGCKVCYIALLIDMAVVLCSWLTVNFVI